MVKNLFRQVGTYFWLKRIEGNFKRISEKCGRKTLEIVENEWMGVKYKITHYEGEDSLWELRLSGIAIPKYGPSDGGPNGIVGDIYGDLLLKELCREPGEPNKQYNFNGEDACNSENTLRFVGTSDIESLPHGNTIARKTIESYLSYRNKINQAIKVIEKIYEIDPSKPKSREWAMDGNPDEHHPFCDALILPLKKEFGLDYLGLSCFSSYHPFDISPFLTSN